MSHLKSFKKFNQDENSINEAKFIKFVKDGISRALGTVQRGLGIDKDSRDRKELDKQMKNKDNLEKAKLEIEKLISENIQDYKKYVEQVYFLNGKDMSKEIDFALDELVEKDFTVPEVFLFNEFTSIKFGKNFGHLIRNMFDKNLISLCIEQLVIARTKVEKKTDWLKRAYYVAQTGKELRKSERPDELDCENYARRFKLSYHGNYNKTNLGKVIKGISKLIGNRCYDEI